MTGDTFFKTRMGQTFFEGTLPELIKSIQTLGSHLKALHSVAEQWMAQQPRAADMSPPTDANISDSTKLLYLDTVYTGTRTQPIHGQRVRVCGVFREPDPASTDFVGARRGPINVQRWDDVSADCWAYVIAFSRAGWMSTTLDSVPVFDLECFAHLLPATPGAQP